jgi:hypothetical protein
MLIGRLKVWNGSYGFLSSDDGDIFVHSTGFIDPPKLDTWYTFELANSDRRPGQKIAVAARSQAIDPKQAEMEAAWEQHRRAPVKMGEQI